MAIDISPELEQRLIAVAHAEGVSVDTFLVRLFEKREEMLHVLHRSRPMSQDQMRDKIDRGWAQSERGDVVDGETFASALLSELDEMDQTRRVG